MPDEQPKEPLRPKRLPRVAILYHYFHPDDVVSARHFGDFATDLAARGWDVEALPCNRGCRDESITYPKEETWRGIHIHRVWRPGFKQSTSLGRIANALWMIGAWARLAFRRGRRAPDVVVIGTDPVLSVLVAPIIKAFNRNVKIGHWAYDLYPEAPIAEGMLNETSFITRFLKKRLRHAYRACDLMVDLGPCMRRLLDAYLLGCHGLRCSANHAGDDMVSLSTGKPRRPARPRQMTLVPWALSEPQEPERPDPSIRSQLFGDTKLGLLYSGNFGRAHSHEEFLALARKLRGTGIHFCFAVRGNRADELKQAVRTDDTNISFAGFASEEELAKRLASADIHLASLRPNWTGVVVPSKFFGSLAAGRPVLFSGDAQSALSQWIREHQVGWELRSDDLETTASALKQLAEQPESLASLQQHCHRVYHQHFSRKVIMNEWQAALRGLIGPNPHEPAASPRIHP